MYGEYSKNEYVYVGNDKSMFVQWVEVDKKIQGQLQESLVYQDQNKQKPAEVINRNSSFTGLHSDDSVSLQFPNGETWTGTLNGDVLSLNVVDDNKKLQTIELRPGAVADYNKASDDLQRSLADAEKKKQRAELQAKVRERLLALQGAFIKFHDSSERNPKHYYPTYNSYTDQKINLNQPQQDYTSQIDLNSGDLNKKAFGGQSYGGGIANNLNPPLYYGVTAQGYVFGSFDPPDRAPTDSRIGHNEGVTGDGGWTKPDITVFIVGYPLRSMKLSDLQKIDSKRLF